MTLNKIPYAEKPPCKHIKDSTCTLNWKTHVITIM